MEKWYCLLDIEKGQAKTMTAADAGKVLGLTARTVRRYAEEEKIIKDKYLVQPLEKTHSKIKNTPGTMTKEDWCAEWDKVRSQILGLKEARR